MPLYEYACKECRTVSEHLVNVGGGDADPTCTTCGSEHLSRMISLVSINRGAQPEGCCRDEFGGETGGMCACEHALNN